MKEKKLSLRSFPKAILHIDCDAFFASCEQAMHPEYKGKPVITGKERGIVAAASYEAKAKGIKRGVPLWEVKKICPDAIILPSDYETYSLFSKRLFEIIRKFTPVIEEYSIDEAFADITGFQRPYHCSYEEIAMRIKNRVEKELGITVSVGLSLSKVLAKVGSKWKKPAGFTPIPGYSIHEFLAQTPIGKIWGIGPKTAAYCIANGMQTAYDFAAKPEEYVKTKFTKPHYEIWQELNGHSVYPIITKEKDDYASISKTKTFTPPSADKAFVYSQMIKNLENACIKARRHNLVAKKVIAFLKDQDFISAGLEASLNRASAFPNDIVPIVKQIFNTIYVPDKLYRATGIVLCDLKPETGLQLSLFEPAVQVEKLKQVYKAIDGIAEKMGKHKIHIGASLLANTKVQHLYDRGDIPVRKMERLKGETKRKHIAIPLIMKKV